MFNLSKTQRLKITSTYLWLAAFGILFYWPLSHWLYPDVYHQLLGFSSENNPESFIKVIGTCGFIMIMMLIFSARDPLKNRDMVKTLIVASLLLSGTYIYVINWGNFPVGEYFNVGLCLFSATFLGLIYPWGYRGNSK